MTKTNRQNFKNEVENFLVEGRGYIRKGNDKFIKEVEGRLYRFDLSGISVRKEVQVIHSASQYYPASKSWVKIWAAYYKDLTLSEKGLVLPERSKLL